MAGPRMVRELYLNWATLAEISNRLRNGVLLKIFPGIFDLPFSIHRIFGQLLLPGPRGESDPRQSDRDRVLADPVRVSVLGQGVERQLPGLRRPLHLHP